MENTKDKELKFFTEHMNEEKKNAFYYLIDYLDKKQISYKINSSFYITGFEDIFCEIQNDFSFEFDITGGKQRWGTIKNKKDVDALISALYSKNNDYLEI